MTYPDTVVKAFVMRSPRYPSSAPSLEFDGSEPWIAMAYISPGDLSTKAIKRTAATMHEAFALALELRRELETKLMDEVHASRAARRAKANPDIVTTGEPA